MDLKLELEVRSVYGVKRIYPINELAKKVTDLLDRKTLTAIDVVKLEAMGFKVVWSGEFQLSWKCGN